MEEKAQSDKRWWQFWKENRKKIDKKETSSTPLNYASLLTELIEIAQTPNMPHGEADELFFWRPVGEGIGPNQQWDARTREIGEGLYLIGNKRLEKMLEVHELIVRTFGDLAGHALSAHWHEIGKSDWENGKGECWLH